MRQDPSKTRKIGGVALGKLKQGLADVVGIAGGAAAPWRDLQQLYITSLGAMSAFGAAEQLGLALGTAELSKAAFLVTRQQFADHRVLQEITLELAALAILYEEVF